MKLGRVPARFACGGALLFLAAIAADAIAQTSPLLLVLNKESSTLSLMTADDGKTLATVSTGEGPHEVIASPDGKLAFVTNYGAQTPGSSLSVIDVPARKELRRVDLGPLRRPHGIAYAGGRVYVTAEVNRLVARYDPASNTIDWLLGTGQDGTHMVLVNADESRLVTANIGSDSISVLERGANPLAWNVTVVPVGRGPEGVDTSPDGKQIWTAHSRDGGVSVIDVASKKVIATFDAGTKRSNRLKFTPDGRHVLISDLDGGELVVVDAAARKPVKRVPLGRNPEGILIAPDGSRAYVAVTGENQIAVIDLQTFVVSRMLTSSGGPDGMAWGKE
jgi:YVTN family beta-propeller protein